MRDVSLAVGLILFVCSAADLLLAVSPDISLDAVELLRIPERSVFKVFTHSETEQPGLLMPWILTRVTTVGTALHIYL